MRGRRSSSSSHSMNSVISSSSSHNQRVKTILKKTYELSTLCDVDTCVIYYGPDGTLKTWPEEREKVEDLALRYITATKPKKSVNLDEFLAMEEEKNKHPKKKLKREYSENVNGIKYPTWYPSFDHYSSEQLDELILSLEKTLRDLQETFRLIEAQRNTNYLVHQSQMTQLLNPPNQFSLHQSQTTQLLDPNQFSLFMYNHGDGTLSKLPLTNYHNQFTPQQQLYGLEDHNIMQQPCFSLTQDSSAFLTGQDSAVNDYLFQNNLMQQQHELYG